MSANGNRRGGDESVSGGVKVWLDIKKANKPYDRRAGFRPRMAGAPLPGRGADRRGGSGGGGGGSGIGGGESVSGGRKYHSISKTENKP